MDSLWRWVFTVLHVCSDWLKSVLAWVQKVTRLGSWGHALARDCQKAERYPGATETWRTDRASRTYRYHGDGPLVTVQTDTHTFYADLARLAECSEYFRALSCSRMREAQQGAVCLDHIPSGAFHNLLEFCFLERFCVPTHQLDEHLRVSTYLLATPFMLRLLVAVGACLNEHTCVRYLRLGEELCCEELTHTVLSYLSTQLFELAHLHAHLDPSQCRQLLLLRSKGTRTLCCIRKENLTSRRTDPEVDAARQLYRLDGDGGEEGDCGKWSLQVELPFHADKWCFTTAVLHNYLYLIGGYRHRGRRGYEFKMASFRYNPLTNQWASTAPLIKHRRHFSTAVCEERVYAVGGWYLDSLASPDASTSVFAAVERYDPWADTWTLVAPLPLTDFQFSLSLSHDAPLTTALGQCVYVLGNVQRTGEKLVLRYDTRQDSWAELLPTLTRADADIPSLYFLGATDELLVIGGNNYETMVTSFCVESHRWGRVRVMEKAALIGQGAVLNDDLYMTTYQQGSVVRVSLLSLALAPLPSLPISTCYESLFHLYF